jgi:drug/metabolite transporter superfamily protein YnfA
MKKQIISILLLLFVMIFVVLFQEISDAGRYVIYGLLTIIAYISISKIVEDTIKDKEDKK